MIDDEEILSRPPMARSIGQKQYVGPGEMKQLCFVNNRYYVVVDEHNHVVKEYITNNHGRTYFIDWDSEVSSNVVDEIFGRYIQQSS